MSQYGWWCARANVANCAPGDSCYIVCWPATAAGTLLPGYLPAHCNQNQFYQQARYFPPNTPITSVQYHEADFYTQVSTHFGLICGPGQTDPQPEPEDPCGSMTIPVGPDSKYFNGDERGDGGHYDQLLMPAVTSEYFLPQFSNGKVAATNRARIDAESAGPNHVRVTAWHEATGPGRKVIAPPEILDEHSFAHEDGAIMPARVSPTGLLLYNYARTDAELDDIETVLDFGVPYKNGSLHGYRFHFDPTDGKMYLREYANGTLVASRDLMQAAGGGGGWPEAPRDNLTSPGGVEDQIPYPAENVLVIDAAAPLSIGGIDPPGSLDPHFLKIEVVGDPVTLLHQHGAADPESRVISPSGANYTIPTNSGVFLWWDNLDERWRVNDPAETKIIKVAQDLAALAVSLGDAAFAEMATDFLYDIGSAGSIVGGAVLSPGGTMSLELDGDSATPGNNKVYGTDGSGVRGWKDDPGGGDVSEALAFTWFMQGVG